MAGGLLAKPDFSALPLDGVRQRIAYDPVTGVVELLDSRMKIQRWKTTRQPPKIIIDGKRYRLGDVLWFYAKGVEPRNRVLTVSADNNDMRLCNLRENIKDKAPIVTMEELKGVLHYDPATGIFIRLVDTPHIASRIGIVGSRAGDRAGSPIYRRGGMKLHRTINLLRRKYTEHRLAWFYMTSCWPEKQIDHINGDPFDNRWCNLREATTAENQKNRGKPRTNTSGFKGVIWHKGAKKWLAQIVCDGKSHYLGLFTDINEAVRVHREAELCLFGEFARRVA